MGIRIEDDIADVVVEPPRGLSHVALEQRLCREGRRASVQPVLEAGEATGRYRVSVILDGMKEGGVERLQSILTAEQCMIAG